MKDSPDFSARVTLSGIASRVVDTFQINICIVGNRNILARFTWAFDPLLHELTIGEVVIGNMVVILPKLNLLRIVDPADLPAEFYYLIRFILLHNFYSTNRQAKSLAAPNLYRTAN